VVTGRNINRVALAQEIAEPGEVVISGATSALLHQARVEQRQSGFLLLSHMPPVDAPPAAGIGTIRAAGWMSWSA
jgi:class 3 adenylate cyclase